MLEWIKKNALICGVTLAGISLILTLTYRPYIYENNLFDFYIADTIGSLFSIPSASLFFYGLTHGRKSFIKIVHSVTVGFFIYEIFSVLPYYGTFDIADLIAMLFSYIIIVALYFSFFHKK